MRPARKVTVVTAKFYNRTPTPSRGVTHLDPKESTEHNGCAGFLVSLPVPSAKVGQPLP